jgi:maleamate amidohydrolase
MRDASIYAHQGFANVLGFGRKSAIIFVDFTVGFSDPEIFGGGNILSAIEASESLLKAGRELGVPICHTRIVYADDGSDLGVVAMKVPKVATLTESHPSGNFVPSLMPVTGEYVVRKTQASGFFGTGLAAWLTSRGADTLIVAGCTTSGCVRATVVDAASANFRPIVAADCCGDRALESHANSLFDLNQKYADVIDSAKIIAHLRGSGGQ